HPGPAASRSQKEAELRVPHRRPFEGVRQNGAGLELQRQLAALDLDCGCCVGRVKLEAATQLAIGDSLQYVLDPGERRHRDLDPRREVLPSNLGLGAAAVLTHLGGERGADARLAIAIAQAANAELADRHEADQAKTTPHAIGRIPMKLEPAEG